MSMQAALSIEPGLERVAGSCACCGRETRVFRGLVFLEGDAYAVYVARYADAHPELGVTMDVSLEGRGEGADPSARRCVTLDWRTTETGPGCAVVDRTDTVDVSTLGRPLSRAEALSSGMATAAFVVADAVWLADARLSTALTIDPRRVDPPSRRTGTLPPNRVHAA